MTDVNIQTTLIRGDLFAKVSDLEKWFDKLRDSMVGKPSRTINIVKEELFEYLQKESKLPDTTLEEMTITQQKILGAVICVPKGRNEVSITDVANLKLSPAGTSRGWMIEKKVQCDNDEDKLHYIFVV